MDSKVVKVIIRNAIYQKECITAVNKWNALYQ